MKKSDLFAICASILLGFGILAFFSARTPTAHAYGEPKQDPIVRVKFVKAAHSSALATAINNLLAEERKTKLGSYSDVSIVYDSDRKTVGALLIERH